MNEGQNTAHEERVAPVRVKYREYRLLLPTSFVEEVLKPMHALMQQKYPSTPASEHEFVASVIINAILALGIRYEEEAKSQRLIVEPGGVR